MKTNYAIIIIGAGIAGLAAARVLEGQDLLVVEKSRGPGGRLAAKRCALGRVDIGAQFFTQRDPRFGSVLADAIDAGAVAPWEPRMGRLQDKQAMDSPDTAPRYVGTPYMNAFGRYLSDGCVIETGLRVQSIQRASTGGYRLLSEDGVELTAERIICTAPLDQMVTLCADFAPEHLANRFHMDPTWTAVFSVDSPLVSSSGQPLDACFGGADPLLDFVAVERSKPGRDTPYLVVHSSPAFAKAALEWTADAVLSTLGDAVHERFQIEPEPVLAHRWRYARPTDPTISAQKGVFCLNEHLWLAGDYLAGGRVEGAYLSGVEAAGRVLG